MKKFLYVSNRYPLMKLKECVVTAETKGDGRLILFTEQKVEFVENSRSVKDLGPQFVLGKVKVSAETLPQFIVHVSELKEV